MAVAERDGSGFEEDFFELHDLQFAGLQGMIDPPRDEARAAVASCRRAGIRPLMITGDHAVTALAIARELGVAGPRDEVVTGRHLEKATDRELEEVTARVSIYARVSPQHKLRIVEALRRRGQVVAVTNSVQDIALAFEPGEAPVLDRSPRPRHEGVISRVLWERTLISAVVMAAGTLLLFLLERDTGGSDERAQNVALTTLVVFSAFHAGNARSEYLSAFCKSPFSNPFLLIGTLAAVGLHALALQLPLTQTVLHVQPLALGDWLTIVAVALTVIVAVEAHKLWQAGPRPS